MGIFDRHKDMVDDGKDISEANAEQGDEKSDDAGQQGEDQVQEEEETER